MILLVGHFMMVARFVRTRDIALDPEPSDWTLVKRDGQWWVPRRTLLPVYGSAPPRALLAEGLSGVLAERTAG